MYNQRLQISSNLVIVISMWWTGSNFENYCRCDQLGHMLVFPWNKSYILPKRRVSWWFWIYRKNVIRFFDFVLTKSMFSQHFTLVLPVDFKLRSVLQNLVSAIKWQVFEWQLFSIGQGKNTKTSQIFYCARIRCDHH